MNLQMRDFLHLMSLMRSVIKTYPLQMTVDSMSRSIWGKAAAGDRGPRRGASAESEEGGRAQGWRAKIVIVMIHEVLGEMWIFNEVEGIFSNKMCECERLTTSYVLYRATQQVAHDLLLKGIQKLRFLPTSREERNFYSQVNKRLCKTFRHPVLHLARNTVCHCPPGPGHFGWEPSRHLSDTAKKLHRGVIKLS